jgi:outer membrane protein assembly factor BamB
VIALDPANGKELWKHSLDWGNLTGERPRLLGDAEALFLLVAKNYGWELHRLDSQTGKSLWRHPRPHSRFVVPPQSVSHDTAHLYYVARDQVHACALKDGRPVWSRLLPFHAEAWRTLSTPKALLVHPLGSQAEQWQQAVATGPAFTANPLSRLARSLHAKAGLQESVPVGHLSILALDPTDGQILQRLNFSANGSQLAVQIGSHALTVVAGDRAFGVTTTR